MRTVTADMAAADPAAMQAAGVRRIVAVSAAPVSTVPAPSKISVRQLDPDEPGKTDQR